MARIRSRGYPNAPLDQVIDNAAKVHSEDRQHPVDRETIARHIGFSGLSGASDRALSALLHFNLMEKVKKGEMRVSDLALRIIHPTNPEERRVALHEAAFSPDLFQELRERYPEAPPSRDTLSSYLSREGFASAAIPAATKAYLETCSFLQQENAYDLSVAPASHETVSAPDEISTEPKMQTETLERSDALEQKNSPSTEGRAHAPREMVLNEPYLDVRGSREVHIEGVFDRTGIDELENTLKALKMLLKQQKSVDPDNGL